MQDQLLTFTATVAPAADGGAPTGTVSFYDGQAIIATAALQAGGTAQLVTSTLALGAPRGERVYSGDGTFAASDSGSLDEIVNAPRQFAPAGPELSRQDPDIEH